MAFQAQFSKGGEDSTAEEFLDKEGVPFVHDRDSGRLFRISGDQRVKIADSDSAAHILMRASRTTAAEAEALAPRLRHARSPKE